MYHMKREARLVQQGLDRGDHDQDHIVNLIHYINEQARKRSFGKTNGPRLEMCDYKTLVELHEGDWYDVPGDHGL